MIAVRPRAAFPLAISALAFLFLGLFLIYPVFSVFAVSFLDKAGHLTTENYVRILGRSFFQQGLPTSPTTGALPTLAAIVLVVPFSFGLALLPLAVGCAILVLAAR